MIKSVSHLVYAEQARADKYNNVKYDESDCQDFCERVLKDCQVRKADGTIYNWTGANKMWRVALTWKGTIEECIRQYGEIPVGSWVFIVKNDGGEKERGYNDREGNAKHVGIYVGGELPVRDSTRTKDSKGKIIRDGVGYRSIKDFTHVGLPFMIDFFDETLAPITGKITKEEVLKALETVKLYILGG